MKPKRFDATSNLSDLRFGVRTRVARRRKQAIDWLEVDLEFSGGHAGTPPPPNFAAKKTKTAAAKKFSEFCENNCGAAPPVPRTRDLEF